MKRATIRGILAGVLAVLPTSLLRAAEQPPCVTFVLDCSKGMAVALKPDDKIQNVAVTEETKRFDAARDELKKSLDKLSIDGSHRVGLWLFGHRLAWEEGKDQPDLKEQTAYLEQTLGFEALGDLFPGDDVELIRPLLRMEPRDVAAINLRLDALKPWGECPLYLAMARAVDSLDRQSRDADRKLIVITCGSNHQGLSKFTGTKSKVLDALESHPVAVHIIRFGKDGDRQEESELTQIAHQSGGSYRRAETATELAMRIDESLSDAAAAPTAIASVRTPLVANPTGSEKVAPSPPVATTIKGSVTYYKDPVKNAKVTLDNGTSRRTAKTDASGRFTFENVSPGNVTLKVEASVKNKIRGETKQLTIETSDKPLVVEIQLE